MGSLLNIGNIHGDPAIATTEPMSTSIEIYNTARDWCVGMLTGL